MALLVVLVLPSAQIKVGAKTLQGLVGTYTDPGGHYWKVTYASTGTSKMHYISGTVSNIVADSRPWADTADEDSAPANGGAGGQYAVDASSAGSVTATLTWVPAAGQDSATDPPPSQVIVEESATASAQGGANAGGTYQADDGLHDPPQTGSGYASSSGTHYSVQDGTSGTITLASVSQTARTPAYVRPIIGGYAGADVTYNVQPLFIDISLPEATPDSNGGLNILIGQGCMASVIGPTNCRVSGHQWSVSGTTFQDWIVSPDQHTATLKSGPGPLNQPTAHWYWSDTNGAKVVKCTATVTPPTGQGAPFTVNLTRTVTLVEPTYNDDPTPGVIQLTNQLPGHTLSGYLIIAGPSSDPASANGMDFHGHVLTPSSPFNGGGVWEFVQINSDSTVRTPNNGPSEPTSINGKTGLDTYIPYAHNGQWAADDLTQWAGDSPHIPVDDQYKSYHFGGSFQMYLLYLPPGDDSKWVPLHEIDWNVSVNANRPASGHWSSWSSNPMGAPTVTLNKRQTTHPTWTQLVVAPQS